MIQSFSSRRADARAPRRTSPGASKTEVAGRTLELLGFRLDRLFAKGAVAVASVWRVAGGFAALDTPAGVRNIARDFLPACTSGDVLRLTRLGGKVRFEVDPAATRKAAVRLQRLLDAVLPQGGTRPLGA